VAYPSIEGNGWIPVRQGRQEQAATNSSGRGNALSNTNGHRRRRRSSQHESRERGKSAADTGEDSTHRTMAHSNTRGLAPEEDEPESERIVFSRSEFDRICARLRPDWPAEPDVGRVAYGIPDRVDRLEGLGNAVVPAQAQVVGELLRKFAESRIGQ